MTEHGGQARGRKAALRLSLTAGRTRRSDDQRLQAGRALAAAVAGPAGSATPLVRALTAGGTVAGFAGVGTEPPTRPLLEALTGLGLRVLLPVLRAGAGLDWASGASSLVAGPYSLLEPAGSLLGVDAVLQAELVLVPALAVDRAGRRLGRGGGYYDRVLSTLPAEVPRVAIVFDDEVLDEVPVEAHDRPVHAVLTPSRLLRFSDVGSRADTRPTSH